MNILLDEVQTRVLGALVEKEITTPEYYPLSLNALVNACNQKSNRDPLMNLGEDTVSHALRALNENALARSAASADSRVTKYEHRLQEAFNFTRPEIAILCELLLRGPQTPGELRNRAARMHPFDDLGVVQTTLQRLMTREPPLVKILRRQPGRKEARYAHLLSGDVEASEQQPASGAPVIIGSSTSSGSDASSGTGSGDNERIARLESEVATLQREIAGLKQQLADLRKQFE